MIFLSQKIKRLSLAFIISTGTKIEIVMGAKGGDIVRELYAWGMKSKKLSREEGFLFLKISY